MWRYVYVSLPSGKEDGDWRDQTDVSAELDREILLGNTAEWVMLLSLPNMFIGLHPRAGGTWKTPGLLIEKRMF